MNDIKFRFEFLGSRLAAMHQTFFFIKPKKIILKSVLLKVILSFCWFYLKIYIFIILIA